MSIDPGSRQTYSNTLATQAYGNSDMLELQGKKRINDHGGILRTIVFCRKSISVSENEGPPYVQRKKLVITINPLYKKHSE